MSQKNFIPKTVNENTKDYRKVTYSCWVQFEQKKNLKNKKINASKSIYLKCRFTRSPKKKKKMDTYCDHMTNRHTSTTPEKYFQVDDLLL